MAGRIGISVFETEITIFKSFAPLCNHLDHSSFAFGTTDILRNISHRKLLLPEAAEEKIPLRYPRYRGQLMQAPKEVTPRKKQMFTPARISPHQEQVTQEDEPTLAKTRSSEDQLDGKSKQEEDRLSKPAQLPVRLPRAPKGHHIEELELMVCLVI
ncbi:hypothetical protein KIN20_017034 [Parelaphostrongylus tenuis]|uniref:Uncharacterized protein n=1 Tax=Parelaphostrongylus tenuis TaxID=148309 RepID=A0AAD5QR68_PARTN|nr:hypothetical protein KIN20_017034 [Parelaphostrongylus tenuis]